MAKYNLIFAFDWTSKAKPSLSPVAQLQTCLCEVLAAGQIRIASFFGELEVGNELVVSLIDITGDKSLERELVTATVVFNGALRIPDPSGTPVCTPYLAAAGPELSDTRELTDNRAYDVTAAPTWSLGQYTIENQGRFAFSAVAMVYDPNTGGLRSFVIDPEMQVGPAG